MKHSYLTASLLSFFSLTFASSSYAASIDLTNSSTVDTFGDVLIQSSDEAWLTNASTKDSDGDGNPFDDDANVDYNVSGDDPISSILLEIDLGLNPFSLTSFPQSFEGSAGLIISLDVITGDTLSFDWNFLTNQDTPDTDNNDYAFVTIGDSIIRLADTNSGSFLPGINAPGTAVFTEQTGIQSFTHTFNMTGTVNVGFGVIDIGDFITSSALSVENVQLTPIPEPLTILGAGTAIGFGGLFKKKLSKRNQKKG